VIPGKGAYTTKAKAKSTQPTHKATKGAGRSRFGGRGGGVERYGQQTRAKDGVNKCHRPASQRNHWVEGGASTAVTATSGGHEKETGGKGKLLLTNRPGSKKKTGRPKMPRESGEKDRRRTAAEQKVWKKKNPY